MTIDETLALGGDFIQEKFTHLCEQVINMLRETQFYSEMDKAVKCNIT